MGATDHGSQVITWGYFQEATAENWGLRLLDVMPVGIYDGGYLSKVTNSSVSLSVMVAEISDGSNQISVRTSAPATLDSTTLDSGSISSATPYLVLRWSFSEGTGNYVEVHALASLSARQYNDVVIGKCVFDGATLSSFDYSDRTFPYIESQNLRVEATSDTELYVRVKAGRFNNGNALVKIGDQKVGPFSVPGAGLSRIDLVYVDFTGTLAIQQGTAAVVPSSPSYVGKLVLAEVRLVSPDTNITWDRITDCRSFLQPPAIVDGVTLGVSASGRIYVNRDYTAPYWDVSVMDANNLTLPSQFTTPIITFRDLSYGTIAKSDSYWSSAYLSNNSTRFRMSVDVASPITKTLKLFSVDDSVYVYIDSVLVYSRTSLYENSNNPIAVNLVLGTGNHTIDVILTDQGGARAHLNLIGDIVDNLYVYFKDI